MEEDPSLVDAFYRTTPRWKSNGLFPDNPWIFRCLGENIAIVEAITISAAQDWGFDEIEKLSAKIAGLHTPSARWARADATAELDKQVRARDVLFSGLILSCGELVRNLFPVDAFYAAQWMSKFNTEPDSKFPGGYKVFHRRMLAARDYCASEHLTEAYRHIVIPQITKLRDLKLANYYESAEVFLLGEEEGRRITNRQVKEDRNI